MSIKETTKKIHFVPYAPTPGRIKDTTEPPFVNVSRKYGTLLIGKKALIKMGMEGLFIHFYYEQNKRIIGWQVTDRLTETELQSKAYRLVKRNKTGMFQASLGGVLSQFRGLSKDSYRCEVMRYREITEMICQGKSNTWYYIQLSDSNDNDKTEV